MKVEVLIKQSVVYHSTIEITEEEYTKYEEMGEMYAITILLLKGIKRNKDADQWSLDIFERVE